MLRAKEKLEQLIKEYKHDRKVEASNFGADREELWGIIIEDLEDLLKLFNQ